MKKIIITALFLAGVWIIGCNKKDKEPKEPKEPVAPLIEFKDISIEEAQQLVQGKWRTFRRCGGYAGCQDVTDSYFEFIGTDKYRSIWSDQTTDYTISEWEKTETGWRVLNFELSRLVNDTLECGTGQGLNSMAWWAVRVKQKK
jgi:hypothetical protein